MVESQDMSLGGVAVMLYCQPCAEERGIPTNTTLDELLSPAPDAPIYTPEQVVCDGCQDVLWDMDDEIDGRNYADLDDDRALDSDPYESDRDEYEPGGMYFEREEIPSRSVVHGHTYGIGRVQAEHWTNDNLDRGYPNEVASWTRTYDSVEAFRAANGFTRQGALSYVEVWLDGVQQFSPEEMARLARVDELGKHLSDELARLLGEFPGATYEEVAEAIARMGPIDGGLS
jgi:hypothetical protein